jgi:hypothetical protein
MEKQVETSCTYINPLLMHPNKIGFGFNFIIYHFPLHKSHFSSCSCSYPRVNSIPCLPCTIHWETFSVHLGWHVASIYGSISSIVTMVLILFGLSTMKELSPNLAGFLSTIESVRDIASRSTIPKHIYS